jgi:hypothetical protein
MKIVITLISSWYIFYHNKWTKEEEMFVLSRKSGILAHVDVNKETCYTDHQMRNCIISVEYYCWKQERHKNELYTLQQVLFSKEELETFAIWRKEEFFGCVV